MKKFDLEAALSGEPVKLACGKKAYVFYDLSRYHELSEYVNGLPLNGIVIHEDNWDKKYPANWSLSGESIFDRDSIIGMWEEPKISIEDLLSRLSLRMVNHITIFVVELLSICVTTQKLVLLIVFQPKMANAFAQKKMLKNGLIL